MCHTIQAHYIHFQVETIMALRHTHGGQTRELGRVNKLSYGRQRRGYAHILYQTQTKHKE